MRAQFFGLLCAILLSGCTKAPAVIPPVPGQVPATNTGATRERLDLQDVLTLADKGDSDAQFELGAIFHDGDGAPQDFAQAINWYTLSAKAGNRQAMLNLGLMYKNGEGMEVNLQAAHDWFLKASNKGDVRAGFQLGSMAYLTKDFPNALTYFLKSAKGGYAEAQLNAGVMNIRGEGMEQQNIVDGYAWLMLAKAGGSAKAASLLESLVPKMTAEQKKEGETRAEELRKQVKNMGG